MGALRTGPRNGRSGEQRGIGDRDNSDKEQPLTAEDTGNVQAPKPKPRDRTNSTSTTSNQTRSNRPERKRHDTDGSQQLLLLGSGTSTDLSDMTKIVNEPLSVSDISTHSGNHLLNNPDSHKNTVTAPVPAQRTKRQQRKSNIAKIESRKGTEDRRESVT